MPINMVIMKGQATKFRAFWKKLKMPNLPTIGEMQAASNKATNEAVRPMWTICRSVASLLMNFL